MAIKEAIAAGASMSDLKESLFADMPAKFTLESGRIVLLSITTLHREGEECLLIAYPHTETNDNPMNMYFVRYNVRTRTGKCTWYPDSDDMPSDTYFTPDYWARAMGETPCFD